MATDWNKPTLTSNYTDFVAEINERMNDLAVCFDGRATSNLPVGTLRWSSATNKWEKWNGTAWADISTAIALPTVTAPALIPSGSAIPTNGMYLPAVNTVGVATSGVKRMEFSATGNIGIGVSSSAGRKVQIGGPLEHSAGAAYEVLVGGGFQSGTTVAIKYGTNVTTLGNGGVGYTITTTSHYSAAQGVLHADSTLSNQYGFNSVATLIGATVNVGHYAGNAAAIGAGKTNYGFYSANNIATGGGTTWGYYAAGNAPNYFAGNVTANAALIQTPTRSTAADGSTVALTTATNHLLYDKATTVAALTIALPSSDLTNGQVITISTRAAITALTINGGTIYGAPTTLAAGGFCSFIYSSGGAAWFRRG